VPTTTAAVARERARVCSAILTTCHRAPSVHIFN
jgi:hypothetical protein